MLFIPFLVWRFCSTLPPVRLEHQGIKKGVSKEAAERDKDARFYIRLCFDNIYTRFSFFSLYLFITRFFIRAEEATIVGRRGF
jgi:hypothetical protein